MFVIVVCCIFAFAIVVAFVLNSKKKAQISPVEKNELFYNSLINNLQEPTRSVLKKLKDIHDENKSLPWEELAKQIGVPKDIIMSKDMKALNDYLKLNGDEIAKDFFQTYMLDITKRFRLLYSPLLRYNKMDALSKFKININVNEELYEKLGAAEWYEETVERKNVEYNGYKWTAGSFASGKLTYSVTLVKDFKFQDFGKVYLTSSRIIFVGNNNVSRSIPYDKIVTFKLFQDGILLGLDNGKLPLIKFAHHDNTKASDENDAFLSNDGMVQFINIVSRILTQTQDKEISVVSTN